MTTGATRSTIARTLGRGVFPHQLSWLIDNAARRLIVSPRTVADRLSLTADSRLLEIGPGSGYFSGEFAKRLPRGRLELFDLQPEMLAKARAKLASAGAANVGFTAGDGANLPFAHEQFDCVVLISVLGEIPGQAACLRAIHRVLRPAGLAVFHESIPDPDLIRFDTLVRMVEPIGFALVRRWGPGWNYTAVFAKTLSAE